MVGESERFRRDLAGVLDRWVADDLVTADHAGRLRAHYQLDALDDHASSRFVQTILVLGAILIGLGAISFIAAHWEAFGPATHAIGCTLLMIAADVGGWHLLNGEKHRRWGTVLLLIGTLLLGADIGLMAQWFQVGGSGGGLFLGWAFGALAMAWGLRHAGVGAIGAAVLLGAGMLDWFAPWLPWAYVLAVVPLALATRSVVLLGLGLAGVWLAIGRITIELGQLPFNAAMLTTAVGCLGLAALGRHEPTWRDKAESGYAIVADRLGVFAIACALIYWSFGWAWGSSLGDGGTFDAPSLASASAFGALAVAAWCVATWRHAAARPGLLAGGLAAGALAAGLVAGAGPEPPGTEFAYVLLANVALAGFALHQAYDGLARAARGPFWTGVALLTIQVACRFMEYDTGLLLKSAAFVAWGVGLILAGLWFEKLRASRRKQVAA